MPDQRDLSDALVIFSVKDKDFLGMNNQFMGETFMKFSEIPSRNGHIDDLPQVHLPLHRPSNFSKYLKWHVGVLSDMLTKDPYLIEK